MIKRILIIGFLFCALTAAKGQKYGIPQDPTLFADSLSSILADQRTERALEIADNLAQTWSDLGADQKLKVIEQVTALHEDGVKRKPVLLNYFEALNNAKLIEGLDAQKTTEYLNMTEKVVNTFKDHARISRFFNDMGSFFEHHALFYARSNKLLLFDDVYSFDFVEEFAPEPIPEVLPEEEPVEDDWSDDDDWEDDWEDDNWEDDDWEDDNWEDDEWEDDSWNEEYEEQTAEEELLAVTGGVVLPPVTGPVIRFEKVKLNIVTPYDSVFIAETAGDFVIESKDFVGKGGKFDWTSAELSADSVYANFDAYAFKVNKPQVKAESAKLTYKGKLGDPIDGVFTYLSIRRDSTNQPVFPRFESYYANIRILDLSKDLIYKGGFTLRGRKIFSSSIMGGNSQIQVQNAATQQFKATGKVFEFADSTVYSPRSTVVIYQGNDSIFHPAMRVKYDYGKRYLVLQEDRGGYRNTPLTSTFFNVDFTADIIRWDLDSDSLDASILEARRILPVVVESSDHYNPEDYSALGGKIYPFNPLSMAVYFSRKIGADDFYVGDLAKQYKKDVGVMRGAMRFLAQKGLVSFNPKNDLVTVKQKAFHLYDAKNGKKDFDNMILSSVTHTDPNVTINFERREMKIRGVEEFKISDSLNVMITPDSSEITLMKNRDFNFDGKIKAGNFEYVGRNFTFNYDSFLINLNEIDSIQFYVQEENSRGSAGTRKVDNSLVAADTEGGDGMGSLQNSSGTLYINKPGNKSAKEKNTNYPRFDSKKGAVVYFDRKEVLNGVYDRSVYFMVPPFDLDSLGDSDVAAIGFEGKFISSGMFPEFEEKLEIMPDYSLGFNHKIPDEGFQLYEGDGRLYDNLSLDKNGLRSSGSIDFLTTSLTSNDFIFYPDSVTTRGDIVDIKEEDFGGVRFPQVHLEDYTMKWLPKKDSMYLSNNADPMQFYESTASLDGTAIVSKSGVYGSGELLTRGSISKSDKMTFEHDRFAARNAQFELQSDNPEKPALFGDDVRLNFNLNESYADISPEVEGEAAIEFPYAQFKTSITQARWDLTDQKITMTKPDDVALESSYFYTTREELDSLRFNATEAVYDINTLELKVSGIPYIVVADAKITPENNEVLILENSRIGRLSNTTIILDTLNGYHKLTDGVIDIISRNEFTGYATYKFVNALNDTVPIRMENFHLDSTLVTESRRNQYYEYHTIANGKVSEAQNILMSPGMVYKGDMILYANRPSMQLDGYIKLDLERPGYNTWIKHRSTGDEEQVVINYDNSVTEDGRKLEAGLYFSSLDNELYTLFIEDKEGIDDDAFFTPSGVLFYDEDKSEYVIQDSLKAAGKRLAGKIFRYNDNTGDIQFEGRAKFINSTEDTQVNGSIIGTGNINNKDYSVNAMMGIDFSPVPSQAFDMMAADFIDVINNLGAPEGYGDPTELLYKLADLSGEQAARAYEEQSLQEYTPLAGFTKETTVPLFFANIDFKYSEGQNAFYSDGKLGLSNINRTDINGAFEGFLEIKKNEAGGPVLNLFIKGSPASWYYFGYEDNRLLVFSSVNNFNDVISKKSNGAKAKLGELVFAPASQAEVLDFINRFRLQYYGIEDPYDLGSEIIEEVPVEGDEEKTDDDDGFDDDGF